MPIIVFITIVNMVAFTVMMPILPLVQQLYSISDHAVGYVVQVFVISSIFGAIIFGTLSDKIGRKYMLLIPTIGAAISYLCASLAKDFTIFLIFRGLNGFFNGSFSVAFAMAIDLSTKETRMKNMSSMGAAMGASIVIGPAVGGFLTSFGGTLNQMVSTPLMLSSVLSLVSCFLIVFLLKETLVKQTEPSDTKVSAIIEFFKLFKNSNFAFMTALSMLYTGILMSLQIYLGLWLYKDFHLSSANLGIFWSSGVVFMILTQITIKKYFYNSHPRKMIPLAFLAMAISYIILYFGHNLVSIYIALAIASSSAAFLQTSINTRLSFSGLQDQQGMIFGLSQSLSAVGRGMGPILGGFLISHFYYNNTWGIIAILLILLALISFAYFKYEKKKIATSSL